MRSKSLIVAVALAFVAAPALLHEAPAAAAGLMTPAGTQRTLAIQDHEVEVIVEDGYAITTIEQTFRNDSATDLEAVYAFPVPEKAAVSEFTYWIDGKPVTAEVMARDKARQVYEQEKAGNRETALAEQQGYQHFEMSVWPVRANGEVRIRLAYIQPAALDAGVGRYAYPLEEGGTEDPAVASFWQMRDAVERHFRFDLTMRTSYPVDALRVPGQPGAVVARDADGHWHVTIESGAQAAEEGGAPRASAPAAALDQDVVVYWRQPAGLPGSLEVTPYKVTPAGRGTFMAVLTPGDDLVPVSTGRDWTFIVDRSGSMAGKMATLMEGLGRAIERLPAQDRYRIVVFNDRAERLFSSFRDATPEDLNRTVGDLRNVTATGGTNLYAGLDIGLERLDADRPSGVVLITDGVANVGATARKDFVDLAAARDVRLFTIVMGNSANRPLLQHLAAVSGGTAMSVSNSDDIAGRLMTATTQLSHHALSDITVDVTGVRTADLTPALLGGLFRGRQLVVFGHYWGGGPATVTIAGRSGGQDVTYRADVDLPATATLAPEIERLWAFAAIEDQMRQRALIGDTADARDAIVSTAVEYGLLTPLTSMVVVRDERFAELGIDRTNKQRLEVETAARTQRVQGQQRAHASVTVGNQPRPHVSTSGGGHGSGAAGPLAVLLLGLLRWATRRRRPALAAGAAA